MSWFTDLLAGNDRKTFDQELDLIIARWTDVSRKKDAALTIQEIGRRLHHRGELILGIEKTRKK